MMLTMAASLARACSTSAARACCTSSAGAPLPLLLLLPLSPLAAPPAAAAPPGGRLVRAHGTGSHTSDNDPEILEREKERNLSGQTAKEGESALPGSVPGAGGWNPRLASDSEEVVKAERAPATTVEEMVELSVKQVTRVTAAEEKEEKEKQEAGRKEEGDE